MTSLRIVTWNINSIRLRLPLLKKLVEEVQPDIVALQETKCPDELLPKTALEALGFPYMVYSGMKGYNGVILLSKLPLGEFCNHHRYQKQDSRHIEACITLPDKRITLHNLYIPAGGDMPDESLNDKFAHKLGFVREMIDWFPQRHKNDEYSISMGDFNIAPFEHDVWSHKQLLDVVSHTPIEVEHLHKMRETLDWLDVARHFTPHSEKLYTWWSYRNHDWRKSNRGRRLDHMWVTPNLAGNVRKLSVLQDARDWDRPSDHVPLVLDLNL